jgi:hypothetical protein
MKNKIAIGIILVSLVAFFMRQQFVYPAKWNQIHVGMSRQQVYDLIGPGVGEFPGWKGPFWSDRGFIVWHELRLGMAGDTVRSVWINRYWGEHNDLGVVRSESADSQR